MLQKLKNKSEGFTIIEVLIVLAIAGLIILIVFLAVPALQRNSRNTQRKNDVSALLGAVQEFANNNGGTLPTDPADITDNIKFGYYEASDVSLATGNATNADDVNTLDIQTGAKCAGEDATTADASKRSVVVLYTLETAGDTQPICQES